MKSDKPFASIIITHWANDGFRSGLIRVSLSSLLDTLNYPAEIIVIDNGEFEEDTIWLAKLLRQGKINTLICNKDNMHFAYARNQGLQNASGDYIVIADNDINYEKPWLAQCINVLDRFPHRKIITTPIYGSYTLLDKFYECEVEVGSQLWRQNYRAGSNCFVARKNDFKEIGMFPLHVIAGSKWNDNFVAKGYTVLAPPKNLVSDQATFTSSYHKKKPYDFHKTLTDGSLFHLKQGEKYHEF